MIRYTCAYCRTLHVIYPEKKPRPLRRDVDGRYPINKKRHQAQHSRNDAIRELSKLGWIPDEIAPQFHLSTRAVFNVLNPTQ